MARVTDPQQPDFDSQLVSRMDEPAKLPDAAPEKKSVDVTKKLHTPITEPAPDDTAIGMPVTDLPSVDAASYEAVVSGALTAPVGPLTAVELPVVPAGELAQRAVVESEKAESALPGPVARVSQPVPPTPAPEPPSAPGDSVEQPSVPARVSPAKTSATTSDPARVTTAWIKSDLVIASQTPPPVSVPVPSGSVPPEQSNVLPVEFTRAVGAAPIEILTVDGVPQEVFGAPSGGAGSSRQAVTPVTQTPPFSQTALADGQFLVRPEIADIHARNTAMERSTTTSPVGGVEALSSISDAALEEGAGTTGSSSGEDSKDANGSAAGSTSSSDAGRRAEMAVSTRPFVEELRSARETSAEPSKPLDIEERMRVVEQVRRRLDSLQLANGRHEVTMRLSPEHLGELRMTIVAERGQVTAQILAESAQAREVMTEGREQLRAALEQKGFTLGAMEVRELSGRDADPLRSSQSSLAQSLDLQSSFAGPGGERRSGASATGTGRAVVRTPSEITGVPSDLAPVAEPVVAGSRRRLDTRV